MCETTKSLFGFGFLNTELSWVSGQFSTEVAGKSVLGAEFKETCL